MNLSEYVGVPFLEKGRDRRGWDCWGCVRHVVREKAGIDLPSYLETYEKTTDAVIVRTIAAETEIGWIKLGKDEAVQPLDFVLMRIIGLPWHIGIVGTPGKVLHAQLGEDTVYESYRCKKWERRLLGFYRHPALHSLKTP